MSETTRCGYVAIIGRPNVGKSTLLNAILGQKISITSPKPQTTRHQVLGVKTIGDIQTVYIDTPGIHDVDKHAMNRYMNRSASSVISDADVVVFIVEVNYWTQEDELVLQKLKHAKAPVVLVINKIDELKNKAEVLPIIDKLKEKFNFTKIVPISALKDENIDALERTLVEFLPHGPHLFGADQVTDKSAKFLVAEIIREKIINLTEQEVPYSTAVQIEDFKDEGSIVKISAIIWVERDGQKAIVIGKQGALLKKNRDLGAQRY